MKERMSTLLTIPNGDWTALQDAANNNYLHPYMDILLDVGSADINCRDGELLTPLHAALVYLSEGQDNLVVVKYLGIHIPYGIPGMYYPRYIPWTRGALT